MPKQTGEQQKTVKEYIALDSSNVTIVQGKERTVMMLERREWRRIRKFLDKVKPVSSRCENACWACLGIFFTSITLIITLQPNEERKEVWILAWTMLIVSLIFSISFALFSNWQKKNTDTSIDQIKEEMDFFEDRFIFSDDDKDD